MGQSDSLRRRKRLRLIDDDDEHEDEDPNWLYASMLTPRLCSGHAGFFKSMP